MMADHYVDVVNEKDEVIGRELKSRRLEGLISRVVVIMIMDSNGNVIVGKRGPHKRFDANQFDLVCGNVNSGEDYHEAAARELKEELGLGCPLVMLDKYYLENVHDGMKVRIFCAAFLGRSDEEPRLNHELVSFKRMSLAEIDSGMRESPDDFTQGFIKEFERLRSKLPRPDGNPRIILATKSLPRQEAFSLLRLDFVADSAGIDEKFEGRPDNPEELVKILAKLKAEAVVRKYKEGIVIGFDSVGRFEGLIMEK